MGHGCVIFALNRITIRVVVVSIVVYSRDNCAANHTVPVPDTNPHTQPILRYVRRHPAGFRPRVSGGRDSLFFANIEFRYCKYLVYITALWRTCFNLQFNVGL